MAGATMDQPRATPLTPNPVLWHERPYYPGQPKSLVGIAVRAFGLGAALSLSLVSMASILLWTSSPIWKLSFHLLALSVFHFLEFWVTAQYNTPEATTGAFLLSSNGPAYFIAHGSSAVECLLTSLFWPRSYWLPFYIRYLIMFAGIVLTIGGQVVRTAAMAQAGESFNHVVQYKKKDSHVLVTTGIYGKLRHPSYFGYFWWGIGIQLVMGNILCLMAYFAVLYRFFSRRIRYEEGKLTEFFGDEYVNYKKRVGTKIPFIP